MLYVLLDTLRDRFIAWGVYWVFMLLDQLVFRALVSASLAFLLVLLAGRPVIGWLRAKKIGDTGLTDAEALRRHTASKANIPTMGGILIVGAIAASTLLLADIRNFYVILGLVVLLWLAALGGVDDWLKLTVATRATGASRQGLYAWEKLVFQLGLGVLIGYFAYHYGDSAAPKNLSHVLNLPFQRTYDPSAMFGNSEADGLNTSLIFLPRVVFVIVALLMITGMSNAVNITDGMDGLAGGISAAVAAGLAVLAYIAGSQADAQRVLVPFVAYSDELLILAAAVAGACLGFLWWNCSPAQVFMGDTGSLALGGTLAYIGVVIRQEILLLIMSGIFLIEIGSVVAQVGYFKYTRIRTGAGQRLFKIAPYHHHLHLSGWTEQQVVARFWILSCILVVLALALVKVR